ncbi:MAG: Mrp/NBP35 family ATP-binding protein [Phycisphaerae bacterium]|nr:Mrp/NBP35 family ATP-binding protein [Phycisphaerae bacterium]
MPLSLEDVHAALSTVQDPDLKQDLVSLRMIRAVESDLAGVRVTVELTTPACPMKERIQSDIEAAIRAKAAELGEGPPATIVVNFTADVRRGAGRVAGGGDGSAAGSSNPLPTVRQIVAVGAGKGGVGKSTVSVNLAVGLARTGARVGLLDADIYGPSLPTMLGLEQIPAAAKGNTLMPFEVHGIKSMTIGKLVDADKALIWRGPMAHRAFQQLATQTEWGELDYLVIDLPPGTGDVALTMSQLLPLSGAVVVCTPQRVALDDARRAVRMFEQLGIPVLGVVENMSSFVADDGREFDLFGKGGAETMAGTMGLPFLGSIPIHPELRIHSDDGTPLLNFRAGSALARSLEHVCGETARQLSIAAASAALKQPTLTVR